MTQNQFKCGECGAVFYTSEDLEQHNLRIHAQFRCDVCGETFSSESELEAHSGVAHPQMQKSDKP